MHPVNARRRAAEQDAAKAGHQQRTKRRAEHAPSGKAQRAENGGLAAGKEQMEKYRQPKCQRRREGKEECRAARRLAQRLRGGGKVRPAVGDKVERPAQCAKRFLIVRKETLRILHTAEHHGREWRSAVPLPRRSAPALRQYAVGQKNVAIPLRKLIRTVV